MKNERYDGMIITGAPLEDMDYEQVDYWDELCGIHGLFQNQRLLHHPPVLGGAGRAVLPFRRAQVHLPQKMFGVFEHRVTRPSNPLVRGFDEVFYAPHSRWAA